MCHSLNSPRPVLESVSTYWWSSVISCSSFI
jgi:hypothetical protein